MTQASLQDAPVAIESADDDLRELALDEVEEITGAGGFEKALNPTAA